jgi:hypothetical protein
MVSEQVTRAWRILRVIAMISGSRVLRAATKLVSKLTLNGDDQLGDDGEDLRAALLEHVKHALDGQEAVGVLLLADTFEEDGQVVVVVELGDVNLPVNAVLRAVFNGDGEVTAVVEATELRRGDGSALGGSSLGFLGRWLVLGLEQRACLASEAFTAFQNVYGSYKHEFKSRHSQSTSVKRFASGFSC